MAVTQTGSASVYQSSSLTPSTSVTVPSDAEIAVLCIVGYTPIDYLVASNYTLGGTAFTGVVTTGNQTTNGQTLIGYVVSPLTGSRTFAGTIGSIQEGLTYVITYFKGIDTTTPIKDSDIQTTSDVDITGLTAATGDMMIGSVYAYNQAPTVTDSSQTQIQSEVYNSAGAGVAIKASATGFAYSNASYSTCAAAIIAAAAATNATVTGVIAAATADAIAPAVSVTSNITVTGVVASATGDGVAPAVSVTSSATVTGVLAEATGDAIAPEVSTTGNVNVSGACATATADGIAPATSVTSSATVTGVIGEATADAIAPAVSTATNITVTSVIAEATADGIAPAVSVTRYVEVTGVMAAATADGIAPAISTNTRETFEAESGSWTTAPETSGTGSTVTRSNDQAHDGTYSAKCFTTNTSAYARVIDDTSHLYSTEGTVWSRAYVYVPAATVSALSGDEYLEVAGYYPSAGGNYGWFLRVRASGAMYAHGYTTSGASVAFNIYGTFPTGQWVEVEIGLRTGSGPGMQRAFSFLINGTFYGWYHQGNLGTADFDRTAFGIVATNSADDLTVYVDDWYTVTAGQFPTGTDNRSTSGMQEIDFRDQSGVQWQLDYGTWTWASLDATYGLLSSIGWVQGGRNHERVGNYDNGWALLEIGWPNGTPADTTPTSFVAPMIAFRKKIADEQNLEITAFGAGDGTVTLRYESWPGALGTIFDTWALPLASIGGGSHIPEAGDKLLVNWRKVNATTLHVYVDYYDASAAIWTYNVIDSTDDVSNESGVNFMDADHGSTTTTINGGDYSIKWLQFGDASVPSATATADAIAPAVSVTSNITVTGVIAEATGDALAPAINATSDITVTGVIATATGDALAPSISVTSNATVTGVIAEATAAAIIPDVSVGTNAIVAATSAEATADALAPAVTTTSTVTVAAACATATADALIPAPGAGVGVIAVSAEAVADALTPVISAGQDVLVTGVLAIATAEAFAPVITATAYVTITGLAAEAFAVAMAPLLGTGRGSVTLSEAYASVTLGETVTTVLASDSI